MRSQVTSGTAIFTTIQEQCRTLHWLVLLMDENAEHYTSILSGGEQGVSVVNCAYTSGSLSVRSERGRKASD